MCLGKRITVLEKAQYNANEAQHSAKEAQYSANGSAVHCEQAHSPVSHQPQVPHQRAAWAWHQYGRLEHTAQLEPVGGGQACGGP